MASAPIAVRLPENLISAVWDYQEREKLERHAALVHLIRIGLQRTGTLIPEETTQDRQSGAEARDWALKTGPKIAASLKATKVSNKGSEYRDADGKLFSIRCARRRNNLVGLYNTMRDRIDYVVGAFEAGEGIFDVYKVDIETWAKHARPGSSGTANKDKLTLLSRSRLVELGKSLGNVRL